MDRRGPVQRRGKWHVAIRTGLHRTAPFLGAGLVRPKRETESGNRDASHVALCRATRAAGMRSMSSPIQGPDLA